MPTQRQWQIWDLEAKRKIDEIVRRWQEDFLGKRVKKETEETKEASTDQIVLTDANRS